MLYTMESAARLGLPCIVLRSAKPDQRVFIADGPLLDSALANPRLPQAPGRPGTAYALYPVPLAPRDHDGRDGAAVCAELALHWKAGGRANVGLDARDVVRRQTGLPWVKPSPNMPDLTSALFYPSLVAFEVA